MIHASKRADLDRSQLTIHHMLQDELEHMKYKEHSIVDTYDNMDSNIRHYYFLMDCLVLYGDHQ